MQKNNDTPWVKTWLLSQALWKYIQFLVFWIVISPTSTFATSTRDGEQLSMKYWWKQLQLMQKLK